MTEVDLARIKKLERYRAAEYSVHKLRESTPKKEIPMGTAEQLLRLGLGFFTKYEFELKLMEPYSIKFENGVLTPALDVIGTRSQVKLTMCCTPGQLQPLGLTYEGALRSVRNLMDKLLLFLEAHQLSAADKLRQDIEAFDAELAVAS